MSLAVLSDARVLARIRQARVARLASADTTGKPHLVPVCFVFQQGTFYLPLDLKPKRGQPPELKRVTNIRANPQAALLLDEYSDDWEHLWYILISGRADLVALAADVRSALAAKYPQYAQGLLPADARCICLVPEHVSAWGAF